MCQLHFLEIEDVAVGFANVRYDVDGAGDGFNEFGIRGIVVRRVALLIR